MEDVAAKPPADRSVTVMDTDRVEERDTNDNPGMVLFTVAKVAHAKLKTPFLSQQAQFSVAHIYLF